MNHNRYDRARISRASARPLVQRAQERPDVLKRACDELKAAQTFSKFAELNALLAKLVVDPPIDPEGSGLGDPDLESAHVQ